MTNKEIIEHIIEEGSRKHVISYDTHGMHCSEPNCEINHENTINKKGEEK